MLRGQSADPPSSSSKMKQRPKSTRSLKTQGGVGCFLCLLDVGLQLLELSILLGQHWEGRSIFWLPTQNCRVNPSMPISTSGSIRKAYGGDKNSLLSFPHTSDGSHRNQVCPGFYCSLYRNSLFYQNKGLKGAGIVFHPVFQNTPLPAMCAFSTLRLLQFKTGFFPPHQPIEKHQFTYGQI